METGSYLLCLLYTSTEAVVRLHGAFEDYNGPIVSGNDLYSRVMRSDPVA